MRVALGCEEFDDGGFELGFGEFHFRFTALKPTPADLKRPTDHSKHFQKRNAFRATVLADIGDLRLIEFSAWRFTSYHYSVHVFRSGNDEWIGLRAVAVSVDQTWVVGEELKNNFLNPFFDRGENLLTCLHPFDERIIFFLQLDVDLFCRANGSVHDEFIDFLPERGKNVRRIISCPSVQPSAGVDTELHRCLTGSQLAADIVEVNRLGSEVIAGGACGDQTAVEGGDN